MDSMVIAIEHMAEDIESQMQLVSRKMLSRLIILKEEAIEVDFELAGIDYNALESNQYNNIPGRFF